MSRTSTPHSNLAARMGRWSADHWKTATFGWLALVVVAFGIGGMVGTKNPDPNTAGPGQSGRMDRILARRLQAAGGRERPDPEPHRHGRHARVRRGRERTSSPASRARPTSGTSARRSPPAMRTRSRRTATPRSSGSTSAARSTRRRTRSAPSSTPSPPPRPPIPGFFIGEMGDASAPKAVDGPVRQGSRQGRDALPADHADHPARHVRRARRRGHPAAARAHGRVRHVRPGRARRATCSRWRTRRLPLVLLIGLAVGVDYSMFYLRREREERAKGRSERAALEAAAATSGRSVLISGLTVMVAMAGMFVTGDKTFASFGVATMMVVAVAMLGSLTVLPALLSRLGDRVDRGPRPAAPPRRRRGPDLGLDRRPRPAAAGALRGDRRRRAAPARPPRDPDADGGPLAGHLPGAARGRQDLQADAAGVPRNGAARERDRQGAERERPGGPRRRSPSSSSGRSRAAARTSRSRSTSTRPARSRTSRSRSTATAPTRRRTRRCRAPAQRRSSPRPSARSRTRRPASPG